MSSSTLGWSACVLLLGTIWGAAALADNTGEGQTTITVRASGKTGSVTRIKHAGHNNEVEQPLPAELNGGTIPSSALRAELGKGIGRFLQQVRTEPVVARRHFVGWRLLTLFPRRTDVQVQGLQVGDIVLRVNGSSVERPEAFKALWDSLGEATELVIEIERAGENTSVRYAIQ